MTRIIFIGDTLFNNGKITFDNRIIEICRSADYVIMNLEGPVTTAPLRNDKPYGFHTGEYSIELLKKLNVSAAILANNHIMDCGRQGLADTLNNLHEAGIAFTGAGMNTDELYQNISFERNDRKFVLMAFTHREYPLIGKNEAGPAPLPDIQVLKESISRYKKSGYFVIFCYHGGEEYFTVPWPRRRSFFRYLNRLGADIIFGNHSHSIQPVEIEGNAAVIYSPGNFYFDIPGERFRESSDKGLIAEIETNENKSLTLHYIQADRDNFSVGFVKSEKFDCITDIFMNREEYYQKWIAECRSYFKQALRTSPPNNNFFYRNLRRINRIRAEIFNLFKAPDISLSKDILLSAVPFIGKIFVKRIDKNGYKKYSF